MALGCLCTLGTAQTAAAQAEAVVAIDTNLPDAVLYADSLRLGRVGDGVFRVSATTETLRLVPEADAWSVEPLRRPLQTSAAGDTVRLSMRFPYHYAVESVPFGAGVFLEQSGGAREKLGLTPLVYRSRVPLTGTLEVERQGYAPITITPGQDVWNRDVLVLQPLVQADVATAEVDWNPPATRRRWIDYAAVGLAAAGGATAIYYKFKANEPLRRLRGDGRPRPPPRDPPLRPLFRHRARDDAGRPRRVRAAAGVALGGGGL